LIVPPDVCLPITEQPSARHPTTPGFASAAKLGTDPEVPLATPYTHLRWLGLVLAASLLIVLRASWPALTHQNIVLDDVRQHAFWVPRLHDPELFRGDPIADYFAAQASPGHTALYFVATLAMDPISFSKLLPLVLTLAQAGCAYLLGWRLFSQHRVAALGAILLTWLTWWFDDIGSASPRSFGSPLLVAFLAFLAGRQRAAALATLVLQALFYPVACGVMLGTQALWLVARARRRMLAPSYRTELRWLLASSVLVSGLVLLERLSTTSYGPLISLEQARQMPEFQSGGRVSYFNPNPIDFWLVGPRTGIGFWRNVPQLGETPILLLAMLPAAALGLWLAAARGGLTRRPPVHLPKLLLLACLLGASFALFFLAHALAFRLYLPARQVQFSLPVVLALAAALFAELLAERLASCRPTRAGTLVVLGTAMLLLAWRPPVDASYVVGSHTQLYAYLRSLPKDTLVAALPQDASSLPLFGQRPVFVSYEHAIPYHPKYYEPLRRRMDALQEAYFAESPRPIIELAEREGIALIVANTNALERAHRGRTMPLGLEQLVAHCATLRDHELVAIPLTCAQAQE
jgi:hypothetical protein